MTKSNLLTPEVREKVTEIQDLLINRYVEQDEALEEGDKSRAIKIEFEIKELNREVERIKGWTTL